MPRNIYRQILNQLGKMRLSIPVSFLAKCCDFAQDINLPSLTLSMTVWYMKASMAECRSGTSRRKPTTLSRSGWGGNSN